MIAQLPRTFISYKSENRTIAERVLDALHGWGFGTWFDQNDIPKGAYFRDEIQRGLEGSDVVIGIVTAEALNSREVLKEWDYAYSRDEKRLLLLRYEDVELPHWLSGVQYIDCVDDETTALDRLKAALETPDTSILNTNSTPDEYRYTEPAPSSLPRYIPDAPTDDNRAKMLYNVYQTWIEGILYPNLPDGNAILLGFDLQPGAILTHPDYPDYRLPDTTHDIGKIFIDMNGELVILGEPTSGKTVLLLQLTEQLLGAAQHDATVAMPAVFNLASWVREQKPLEAWLVDELGQTYGVPKKTGAEWITGSLTLLLDGLDEIAPADNMMQGAGQAQLNERAIELRTACIEAINTYRTQHPHVSIVVCSCVKDYNVLSQRLDLNAAIQLDPLTDTQIEAYLAEAEYAGIREMIAQEDEARSLARSPFLLTMMKSAYAGIPYIHTPHNQLKLTGDADRQTHLLDAYVEKQVPPTADLAYPHDDTLYWLCWLAWQMMRNKRTLFYVEDLQPSWSRYEQRYRLIFGLILGLILGLSLMLVSGLIVGLSGGLIGGLIFGLILGLILRLGDIKFSKTMSWSLNSAVKRENLIIGLIGGLIFVRDYGLIVGLGSVLFLGLIFGMRTDANLNARNYPNVGLRLSLKNGLVFGLVFGLILGVSSGLSIGLTAGLGSMLFGVLFGGLFGGWKTVIQHVILRLTLAREGVIPRGRYDRFLDYCANELGLLRKVGGGYIFRHRILLEYFAAQYEKHHKTTDRNRAQ